MNGDKKLSSIVKCVLISSVLTHKFKWPVNNERLRQHPRVQLLGGGVVFVVVMVVMVTAGGVVVAVTTGEEEWLSWKRWVETERTAHGNRHYSKAYPVQG